MNKEMRNLQAEINEALAEVKTYKEGEQKDLEKAKEAMTRAEDLQAEYDLEAKLFEAEKKNAPAAPPVEEKKADGFKAMTKLLKKQGLTEQEKALISGEAATAGENLLVPEDVKAEINELRKSYTSAKPLVSVVQTDSLAGSINFEAGTAAGLTEFEDGDAIAEGNPTFDVRKFAIKWFGKIVPVSRILLGAEKAGLLGYLDRWFVKNAVLTENAKIFEVLKAGYNSGTPKALAGWKAFKKSINVDLDPACLLDGAIITNQSGFAALDEEEDKDGRPVLQPNPANPTQKLFQGLPVHVFPDAQLANIDATHFPVIYGSLKAGCTFVEHKALEFAASEHANFNKNQNTLRVIEGFDVMAADTTAYVYGSFAATTA